MLEGKVAVVTGAPQGIGYAISEEFAKQGSDVVLTDYNDKVVSAAGMLVGDTYAVTPPGSTAGYAVFSGRNAVSSICKGGK
ncbi:SDR family NAD(P)-dependent oxidoreductase [Lactobacillus sp. XV13L]|nr:SDR family NAD(P)-dependent oxidoreductase [Lactobacillus sp. XV13L]